jgi:hypothetical protein
VEVEMPVSYKDGHGTTKDYTTGVVSPLPTYDGAVLGFRSRTERVMSDVWEYFTYAVVWDGSGLKEVTLHSTYPSHYATATVDATPDVKAAALAFLTAKALAKHKAGWADNVDKAVAATKVPSKGKSVVVVKGRKVPKGTTGTVVWYGPGKNFGPVPKYRGGWSVSTPMRVGLKDASGTVHWTDAANVEVTNPDDYLDPVWMTTPDFSKEAASDAAFEFNTLTAVKSAAA